MQLIFITNDPQQAKTMASAGVDRIMVDLEINGKHKRQGHLNTVISGHTFEDVSSVRNALDSTATGSLMVRVNPLGSGSKSEIDAIISRGADRIMLPMFTHPSEITDCLELINGRVPLTLLLETSAALARLPQILAIQGFDDIHIGLNDLHIDMGLDFMFELFGSGLLDHISSLIRAAGYRFGIGGVSCIGTGMIPAELVLASHMSLGSDRVILSRAFSQALEDGRSAADEITKLRTFLNRNDLDLRTLRQELHTRSTEISNQRRMRMLDS